MDSIPFLTDRIVCKYRFNTRNHQQKTRGPLNRRNRTWREHARTVKEQEEPEERIPTPPTPMEAKIGKQPRGTDFSRCCFCLFSHGRGEVLVVCGSKHDLDPVFPMFSWDYDIEMLPHLFAAISKQLRFMC